MQEKAIQTLENQLVKAQQTITGLRAEIKNYKHLSEKIHSQQRNHAVLAATIETTSDLIAALDDDNRVLLANEAFRMLISKLYGHDVKPLDHIMGFLPDERKKFWENTIRETKTSGGRRFDLRYYIEDRRHDIEWSTSCVQDSGGRTIAVALFGREITSRRVAEENLRERDAQLHHAQKLEAVGTMAGGVAHEFNNALSIVLGNLELAAMDIYADLPVQPYIEDAKTGILRAKKLARQLLEFSKKSDGRQQKVDIHAVSTNALSLLRASIPTHIEFHQLINECPPVMADPSHIHQLIVNLCSNSAEVMDREGGVLTVTLDPVRLKPGNVPGGTNLEPGTYAKLTVADTGPGSAAESRDRNAEPYRTPIEPDRGDALGLSVVRGIVRSYSGDIVTSTVLDRGAKYEVYLPTVPQQSQDESVAPDLGTLTGNERILLVDDEPKFVMVTQKQLEHLGYHVNIYTSAVSAMERFKAAPGDFDLVITDVAMPKMTGDKFINQIRLLRPDIPAILCTGYSNKVDKEMAAYLGCAYIIKPVERNRLAQLIRETLDKSPAIGSV